jgi:glycosyltransferase involved in cell wall biosynthesis
VLLEAAAMGLPIITSDAPGCREVVARGVSGLLVTPGNAAELADAVTWMAERPAARRRMGLSARQRAEERFDLAVIAAQTSALYRELLREKGLASPMIAGCGGRGVIRS